MNTKTTRLAYSTDPELNKKCQKCKEVVSECTCVAEVDPKSYKFVAVLRIEKQKKGNSRALTFLAATPKTQNSTSPVGRGQLLMGLVAGFGFG